MYVSFASSFANPLAVGMVALKHKTAHQHMLDSRFVNLRDGGCILIKWGRLPILGIIKPNIYVMKVVVRSTMRFYIRASFLACSLSVPDYYRRLETGE